MKADVMARDTKQGTPMHDAAFGGYTSTCQALHAMGADATAQDIDRSTPSLFASNTRHTSTCLALGRLGLGVGVHLDQEPLLPASSSFASSCTTSLL